METLRASLIFIIFTVLISCKPEVEINLHPLQDNLHLNRVMVESAGFEFFSADHGLCWFQRDFDTLSMVFIFRVEDDCDQMWLQSLEFPIGEFEIGSSEDSAKVKYSEFPMDNYQDSLRISTVIEAFGGRIISNKKGYDNIVNRYDVENIKTGQVISASVHYKLDSKKYLNIEVEK